MMRRVSEFHPGIQDTPDGQKETHDLIEETKASFNLTINKLDRVFGAVLGNGIVLIALLITLIVLTS